MAKCYETEFDWFVSQLNDQRQELEISSIFFGGGSPSTASTSLIDRVLKHIQTKVPFSNNVEITLEANPTVSETQYLTA
jgi:coproporphyrinogen III oxidase-like Fe-S oxidoreductase